MYYFKVSKCRFSSSGVEGGGPGGTGPPPPLGFKVSIARQNFGQFHIFWAILRQNFGRFHMFWAILRQIHIFWAILPP